MREFSSPGTVLDEQRGFLFPWVPICLALGIGVYFKLPVEPHWVLTLAMLGLSGGMIVWLVRRQETLAIPAIGVFICLFGVGLGGARTIIVDGPILSFRYYGPIEGRLVGVDRSTSDKIRLTMDRVILSKVDMAETPSRVRLSIHTKGYVQAPEIGSTVILTGHLSRPQGPAEPGGFDFQRFAWFKRLGAVGYTRTPVLLTADPRESDLMVLVSRLRQKISSAVQIALPGDKGGFAAAILTGDRSGIDQGTMENLRRSNLAHLLAISGLHMGLLTGFVFVAIRVGFALVPYAAHRIPVKKIAAIGALIAGACYLVLSGGAVATERAYIMAAMMLSAVLMDRRALTLRAVALAAIVVLVLRPEALVSPGFQMSFAATTALVVAFRAARSWKMWRLPVAANYAIGLLLSSAVAGLATAPIGAAHFNQVAHYGLLANTLSVPLMGAVIIPSAVFSALLWPIGLEGIGLYLMAVGIEWILGVAQWVSGLEYSVSHVATPHWSALPLIALGGLTLVLWRGRARTLGLVLAIAGFLIWNQSDRPLALVSGTGGLVGVMTENGRSVSKPRGDGFSARSWLENDGEQATQQASNDRGGFLIEGAYRISTTSDLKIAHLTGKTGASLLDQACAEADIVVTNFAAKSDGCRIFDPNYLRTTGSIAIDRFAPLKLRTAAGYAGARPWNR